LSQPKAVGEMKDKRYVEFTAHQHRYGNFRLSRMANDAHYPLRQHRKFVGTPNQVYKTRRKAIKQGKADSSAPHAIFVQFPVKICPEGIMDGDYSSLVTLQEARYDFFNAFYGSIQL
jgi:hypothetical protein